MIGFLFLETSFQIVSKTTKMVNETKDQMWLILEMLIVQIK